MAILPVQLTGGGFQTLEGDPLENGYLRLFLSQDANITGVGNICSGVYVQVQLDQYGNASVEPPQYAYGNNEMLPVNTFYRVFAYTAEGQLAWGPNAQQIIGNGGTFDLGTWIPNQVISWVPPLQALELEVNGTPNQDQTLLNLTAGSGITITDEGNGEILFASGASPYSPAGSNVVSLPQFNDQDGGLANYTMVMKIPAGLIQAIGTSVIVTAMTGSNPGGTGFEWTDASIGATLPSRYIPGVISTSVVWTTAPVALTWPSGSFTSASTAYPSNPATITIDTNHDYYVMFYINGANTSNIPMMFVPASSQGTIPPQWQDCFGYLTGDHTADSDASAFQSLSSNNNLHLFSQVQIG